MFISNIFFVAMTFFSRILAINELLHILRRDRFV